jgi:hypothetical protein
MGRGECLTRDLTGPIILARLQCTAPAVWRTLKYLDRLQQADGTFYHHEEVHLCGPHDASC